MRIVRTTRPIRSMRKGMMISAEPMIAPKRRTITRPRKSGGEYRGRNEVNRGEGQLVVMGALWYRLREAMRGGVPGMASNMSPAPTREITRVFFATLGRIFLHEMSNLKRGRGEWRR